MVGGWGVGERFCQAWSSLNPAALLESAAVSRGNHRGRSLLCAMAASALLKSRVRRPSMLQKLAKTSDLIDLFPNGASIGWSGFTGVGYPKYV